MNSDLESILYFSGYIDGDGCFSIKNGRKRHCTIIVISTNSSVLYDFAESFGGSVYISIKGQKPGHKPYHRYSIGGIPAWELAMKVRPFLVEKAKQASIFCSFYQIEKPDQRMNLCKELAHLKKNAGLISKNDVDSLKSIKPTVQPSEEDFVYLAGFIDAECNLGVQHYKPSNRPNMVYKIVLQCNNSKSPIFYWLKKRFGGEIHFVDRSKMPNHRSQILWKKTGNSLFEILKRTHPYLRYKKPVCEMLIEFYKTTLPNGGDRHTEAFRKSYRLVLDRREEIVRQVHDHNGKGI